MWSTGRGKVVSININVILMILQLGCPYADILQGKRYFEI